MDTGELICQMVLGATEEQKKQILPLVAQIVTGNSAQPVMTSTRARSGATSKGISKPIPGLATAVRLAMKAHPGGITSGDVRSYLFNKGKINQNITEAHVLHLLRKNPNSYSLMPNGKWIYRPFLKDAVDAVVAETVNA